MGFFRNLVRGERRGEALLDTGGLTLSRDLEETAKSIWRKAETMGAAGAHVEVDVGGHATRIDVDLYTYGVAKKAELEDRIATARGANLKIDASANAEALVIFALYMAAGHLRRLGHGVGDFASLCRSTVRYYDTELKPIAANIDRGHIPPTRIGTKFSLVGSEVAAVVRDGFNVAMVEGMNAVIDFLNGYVDAGRKPDPRP